MSKWLVGSNQIPKILFHSFIILLTFALSLPFTVWKTRCDLWSVSGLRLLCGPRPDFKMVRTYGLETKMFFDLHICSSSLINLCFVN